MNEEEPKYNINIRLKFITEKKLNVGSAYTVKSRADLPFQRIVKGKDTYLYIPGSTIKGVLRTSLIKIAKLIGFKDISWKVEPEVLSSSSNEIVTKLFGKPHDKESKVFVEPIYILNNTQILPHIRIDDRTGVCEERALFTVEYLPIGIEFETTIHGYKLSIEEARALFAAILEMKYGRIGKDSIVDVKIIANKSNIPRDIQEDKLIKTILEAIKV